MRGECQAGEGVLVVGQLGLGADCGVERVVADGELAQELHLGGWGERGVRG